jgi:hypothetical protein
MWRKRKEDGDDGEEEDEEDEEHFGNVFKFAIKSSGVKVLT